MMKPNYIVVVELHISAVFYAFMMWESTIVIVTIVYESLIQALQHVKCSQNVDHCLIIIQSYVFWFFPAKYTHSRSDQSTHVSRLTCPPRAPISDAPILITQSPCQRPNLILLPLSHDDGWWRLLSPHLLDASRNCIRPRFDSIHLLFEGPP